MHTLSPTSPVLGDPLQLFPAQPRNTDLTFVVNRRVFVVLPITLEFQNKHDDDISHAINDDNVIVTNYMFFLSIGPINTF